MEGFSVQQNNASSRFFAIEKGTENLNLSITPSSFQDNDQRLLHLTTFVLSLSRAFVFISAFIHSFSRSNR